MQPPDSAPTAAATGLDGDAAAARRKSPDTDAPARLEHREREAERGCRGLGLAVPEEDPRLVGRRVARDGRLVADLKPRDRADALAPQPVERPRNPARL